MKINFLKIVLFFVFILFFVSCSTETNSEMVSENKANFVNYEYTENESDLADAINSYRLSKGLNALILENYVSKISENHANYMIDKNAISHDLFQERYLMIVQNIGAKNVAENVAYKFNSSESTLNAWLNSQEHKKNLEGDFTHFGISIKTNANGVKFYTNIFVRK